MGLAGYLKRQDRAVSLRYTGHLSYFNLSPSRVALHRTLEPLIQQYAKGRCLDAGAGWLAHRPLLQPYLTHYIALDRDPQRGRCTIRGTVLELPLADCSFDTVYSSQVVEHVTDDLRYFREMYRVLKPGGILILSAPHLAYLHNEPFDFRRFTKHGLRLMAERTGYEPLVIEPAGGLLCFLMHPFSMLLKALVEPVPLLREIVGIGNGYGSRLVEWFDRKFDRPKRYALNYVLVARKPE